MASGKEKGKTKSGGSKLGVTSSSIDDDPVSLKKKIAKFNEFFKDLEKESTASEQQLQTVLNELRATKKIMDETKIESDFVLKSKNDIDIQYKHVSELKKEQEKEIIQLLNVQADLQMELDNMDEAEVKWSQQKDKEISEFEHQKNLIQIQSRFLGRKLEDDRRHLQSKFFEAKQELKRNFRLEVDQLKQRQDLQLSDFERDSKIENSSLKDKISQKIKNLEVDNYNMRTRMDAITQTITKQKEETLSLEKRLAKETASSEAMGNVSVEWLDQEQRETFINEFLTSEEKTLDRMLQQIRDKMIAAGEELLLAKRRRAAAERQVRELRHDQDEQSLLFTRLETSKNDIERRLTKRIEQLEDQIVRKNRHTEADFMLLNNKLKANVDDKDDLLVALKKDIDELQIKIKGYKLTATKMSEKASDKLDIERERFILLEKEKHDLASEGLHYKRDIGDLKEKITALEKELNRYKVQGQAARAELDKFQEKSQVLEQSVRRLESTPIKA